MKRLSETVQFREVIARAEASIGGQPTEHNNDPGKRDAEAKKPASFAKAFYKRQLEKANVLFQLAKEAGKSTEEALDLAAGLKPPKQIDWTFVMISPQQNAEVVRWLNQHSKRPMKAVALWAHLFEVMHHDTGEVLRSRKEIAERVGISTANVSEIMGDLASINAVRRVKRGREVRYFMNANIATHIPGPKARKNARAKDGPLLAIMEGGQANV